MDKRATVKAVALDVAKAGKPQPPIEQVVSTHSLNPLNPREVVAIWRAFLADEIDEILHGDAENAGESNGQL